MSELPDTPRSSCFSPTLDCIPEVFEYEELDGLGEPATPNEITESTEVLLPERSTVATPKLSRRTARATIIQSRTRKPISLSAISKRLRNVLDADRMRRSRIMKVYLKAIMFLKYLWAANERYGAVMLTSGMYVQR
ncbi:hypothetical protein IQ07DRAFT_644128 [Pyrenochaeta sp. DS3sAY3a]|nr:hypothetical protein IQ07DRAFT_644128 [Pyrenochaeta sp. DS3sAY3a]